MSAALLLYEPDEVQKDASAQPGSVNSALEEHLRAALGGRRHVPFDRQLRADCFLLGALCAKAGVQIPGWMSGAVLWADEAALRGYTAFRRQRASIAATDAAEHPREMG